MIPVLQSLIVMTGLDYRFFGNQAGVLSVSIAEAGSYLVLVLLGLAFLRSLRGAGAAVAPFRFRSRPLLIAYVFWMLVSALGNWLLFRNADALHSLKDAIPGLVLYVAVCHWVRTDADTRRVVSAVLVTLTCLGIVGLCQFIWGGPYPSALEESAFGKFALLGSGRIDRPVVGSFGTPNSFAVFYAPLFLLALCFSASKGPIPAARSTSLRYAVLGLAALVLVLAQAKIVLSVTVAAAGAYFVVRRGAPMPDRRATGVVLAGLAVILSAGVILLAVRESSLPEGLGLGTMRGRVLLVDQTINFLTLHPRALLWGGAVQQFGRDVPVLYIVHNEYMLQVLKWGLPGAAAFTLMLFEAIFLRTRLGWAVAVPLIAIALVLLLETAVGNQRQSMVYLLLGLAHSQRLDSTGVPGT